MTCKKFSLKLLLIFYGLWFSYVINVALEINGFWKMKKKVFIQWAVTGRWYPHSGVGPGEERGVSQKEKVAE